MISTVFNGWYLATSTSVVLLLLIWFSFPSEIVTVIFLCEPSLGWIQNIVSPAHHFAVFHCSWKSLCLHREFRVSVSCTACEMHKRALVCSPGLKFNDPVLSNLLVHWMIMNVLSLRVIDPGNLASVNLSVPRVWVNICRSACSFVVFFSLVESYSVDVLLDMKWVSIGADTFSLNSAINKFLSVWRGSWRDCPDVIGELCWNCFQCLLGHYLAHSSDIFWHIKIIKLLLIW